MLDDFFASDFDSLQHGFIGGATLGAEQQFLPIQISREALPPDVQRWGKPYKDHLRKWQNLGVVRIQPDTLSYTSNFIDLDPHYRDRSGLVCRCCGLPMTFGKTNTGSPTGWKRNPKKSCAKWEQRKRGAANDSPGSEAATILAELAWVRTRTRP